jgi:hypothetical protein
MSLFGSRIGAMALAGALTSLAPAAQADPPAATLPLTVEFDTGATAKFGTVVVTEDGTGALSFDVTIHPHVLGPRADLHMLYFNLEGPVPGLAIATWDPVYTLYSLRTRPAVAGGAGSRFDFAVHFGNGASRSGNGVLQHARFTLYATHALSLHQLLPLSSTSRGIVVNMAAHVQGTSFAKGAGSETVGGLLSPLPPEDPKDDPAPEDPKDGWGDLPI